MEKTKVYFIDYENIQPNEKEVRRYLTDSCEIYLFHGVKQNNFPVFWLDVGIDLGDRFHRIQLQQSLKNGIDFLIAYHIGVLSQKEIPMEYCIISNDKGYDHLINYLKRTKIKVVRIGRPGVRKSPKDQKHLIVEERDVYKKVETTLNKLNPNRWPKTKRKLINSVQFWTGCDKNEASDIAMSLNVKYKIYNG